MKNLPMSHKDIRKITRFFLAGATLAEVDKQGRILIPAVLREFAQITKEAVLLGVGNRIEIWSKEKWEEEENFDDMDEVAERMADLGFDF
jgi:MraZ protein